MPANDAKVTSALICDDVRQEQNHKMSLIGVYGGRQVNFRSLPARQSGLHFVRIIEGAPEGTLQLTHTLRQEDGEEIHTGEDEITGVDPDGATTIIFGYGAIQFDNPMSFDAVLTVSQGGEQILTHTLTVNVTEDPSLFAD